MYRKFVHHNIYCFWRRNNRWFGHQVLFRRSQASIDYCISVLAYAPINHLLIKNHDESDVIDNELGGSHCSDVVGRDLSKVGGE
jgi:hypothetical protein